MGSNGTVITTTTSTTTTRGPNSPLSLWALRSVQLVSAAGMAKKPPADEPQEGKKRTRGGYTALEIADQVETVRQMLVKGHSPSAIRRHAADEWGLSPRTGDNRIADARRVMVQDIGTVDRQEMAAQLLQTAAEILKEAQDSRQLSNALGAIRFQSEVLGIISRGN